MQVFKIVYHNVQLKLGYEPADLTVHPPPPRTAESGLTLFAQVSSVPPKNVPKGKPEYPGATEAQRPKNAASQHTHSNPILINSTLFDN